MLHFIFITIYFTFLHSNLNNVRYTEGKFQILGKNISDGAANLSTIMRKLIALHICRAIYITLLSIKYIFNNNPFYICFGGHKNTSKFVEMSNLENQFEHVSIALCKLPQNLPIGANPRPSVLNHCG